MNIVHMILHWNDVAITLTNFEISRMKAKKHIVTYHTEWHGIMTVVNSYSQVYEPNPPPS